MSNKDSPTLREEARRAILSPGPHSAAFACLDLGKSKDQLQAEEELKADTLTMPGGFRNDPDDPTNPNEVRERHLRKLRAATSTVR